LSRDEEGITDDLIAAVDDADAVDDEYRFNTDDVYECGKIRLGGGGGGNLTVFLHSKVKCPRPPHFLHIAFDSVDFESLANSNNPFDCSEKSSLCEDTPLLVLTPAA
jgi:hypothetical protein